MTSLFLPEVHKDLPKVTSEKYGYIVYHSNIIKDYSFIPVNIDTFDGNLYEKKIICTSNIEIFFDNEKYILEKGTHYFPKFSSKSFIVKDMNIEIYQIYKPNELVVSRIFKEKQKLIDKYFQDINHSKKIGDLFQYYQVFIPNLKHTYKYLFSFYQDQITYTKYMTLTDDIKDSIYHQNYKNNYIEKRVKKSEYKGKREVLLEDHTIVENIIKISEKYNFSQDEDIKKYIVESSILDEKNNSILIKYYYKDHSMLRKYLRGKCMIILCPPKYEQFVDVYEPYSEEVIEEMWKIHFDNIDQLEKEKHISFYSL